MDTKKMYLSVLLVFTVAMYAFGQNPKREVIFTLNANEEIYYNEYYLSQTANQNHFACVIYNTLTKKYTFVFNGKRIKEFDNHYERLYSFNVGKNNTYVLTYRENGKWYIDYNGIVDGGFDDIRVGNRMSRYYMQTPEKNYDYLYKLAGKWYAHKNGKNRKIAFIEFCLNDRDFYCININGNISGSYESIHYDFTLTESGKYAYCYKDNGEWYANINGNISKPYIHPITITLTESGKYAYCYGDNRKWYVNINGSITENVYNYILTENGKYAYIYKDNGKEYANINGNISNPYGGIGYLTLTESGKYAYTYEDNGKWYANINGSISKPCDNIFNLTLTESGNYVYHYDNNEKLYVNNNGCISHSEIGFDGNVTWWRTPGVENYNYVLDGFELNSKNDEHFFHSSYEYEYVVIDGRPHGKSPSIQAWYDEKKNAFVWTGIEGKELVVYEYKLD
jgi:hypothetical protein